MIPVRDQTTGQKFYYLPKEEKSQRGIPEPLRRRFARHQITVVEFTDLTQAQERDMFSRVQMGMTLSPAESMS